MIRETFKQRFLYMPEIRRLYDLGILKPIPLSEGYWESTSTRGRTTPFEGIPHYSVRQFKKDFMLVNDVFISEHEVPDYLYKVNGNYYEISTINYARIMKMASGEFQRLFLTKAGRKEDIEFINNGLIKLYSEEIAPFTTTDPVILHDIVSRNEIGEYYIKKGRGSGEAGTQIPTYWRLDTTKLSPPFESNPKRLFLKDRIELFARYFFDYLDEGSNKTELKQFLLFISRKGVKQFNFDSVLNYDGAQYQVFHEEFFKKHRIGIFLLFELMSALDYNWDKLFQLIKGFKETVRGRPKFRIRRREYGVEDFLKFIEYHTSYVSDETTIKKEEVL